MTDNKPTHEDELKAYPDEIGICAFKDGTYEVYPEHAEIAPAVKYIRADRASTPPAPQAEGEGYNHLKSEIEYMQMLFRNESQRAKSALGTLITAATECQFNAERARALQEQVLSDYDVIDQLRLELAKSKEQGK